MYFIFGGSSMSRLSLKTRARIQILSLEKAFEVGGGMKGFTPSTSVKAFSVVAMEMYKNERYNEAIKNAKTALKKFWQEYENYLNTGKNETSVFAS